MTPATGVKRKRSVVESAEVERPTVKHLALREIELEIAMKKRIAEAAEARIAWALFLQESLHNEPTVNDPFAGSNEFQNAAVKALDAIERPCDLILTREPLFASGWGPNTDNCDAPIGLPPHVLPDDVDSLAQNQHSPQPSTSRHRIVRNPNSNVKLLFIRDTSVISTPGTSSQSESKTNLARIQCSDCGRWDFSNLQGFLNHCRIRHQREYGSHDDCIQECSVLVTPSDRDWVLQNGTEITGIGIPGLRRLFEIAVGKKTSLFPAPKPEPSSDQDAAVKREEDGIVGEAETEGTYLSRTLGVHEETPALAAILGRRAARRQIRVFNEDGPVDIEGDSDLSQSRRRWKMIYSHRNLARPELEVDLDMMSDNRLEHPPSIGNAGGSNDGPCEVIPDTGGFGSTRFHIACRIIITDRSRWLSPEARSPARPDDTHNWVIAIQSPSYGLDVTRVLARMTVTCASDHHPKSFIEPLVVSSPPFVIGSTTDVPFLARVTLDWNGQQNAQTVVEHWVQVDLLRTGYATFGQEQLLDIELDRNTPLSPQWGNSTGPVIDEPEMPDPNIHLDHTSIRFTELAIPSRSILAEATRVSGRSGIGTKSETRIANSMHAYETVETTHASRKRREEVKVDPFLEEDPTALITAVGRYLIRDTRARLILENKLWIEAGTVVNRTVFPDWINGEVT